LRSSARSHQRTAIERFLEQSPSLQPLLDADTLNKVYGKAVRDTVIETDLERHLFPVECPYRLEQILDEDGYPSLRRVQPSLPKFRLLPGPPCHHGNAGNVGQRSAVGRATSTVEPGTSGARARVSAEVTPRPWLPSSLDQLDILLQQLIDELTDVRVEFPILSRS